MSTALSQTSNTLSIKWELELFYDGGCPLCSREIAFIRGRDKHGRICFTDIAAESFDTEALGVEFEQLMAEIHGRLPDGRWIRGVEVFRRLYTAIGWNWIVAATRWPGVKQALDLAYRVFAKNRLRWTGRCTTACGTRSST